MNFVCKGEEFFFEEKSKFMVTYSSNVKFIALDGRSANLETKRIFIFCENENETLNFLCYHPQFD